jgi:hypothetical protein
MTQLRFSGGSKTRPKVLRHGGLLTYVTCFEARLKIGSFMVAEQIWIKASDIEGDIK